MGSGVILVTAPDQKVRIRDVFSAAGGVQALSFFFKRVS